MLQKVTCQTCGSQLELSEDGLYGKCPYCQNEYHFKEEKAEALVLMLNLGFENLNRHDFDGAISTFRSVAANYPEDAEANWGLVISTYGIIFEKDDRTGKMIPTCSRIVENSILANKNYKKAIENAHPEQRPFYEEMAREIEKKQVEIKRIMENEESYDAFISFKATDMEGRPTKDSRIARKIYDELTKRDIKTFFSPVTLSTRAGEDYEPIIYKALNTCRIFILVATKEENLNATWVKNEWTRFRDRMDEDKGAIVVPVYDGAEILRAMPTKFQRTQGVDIDKHLFDYDMLIADSAENVLGISERKRREKEERERKEKEERDAKERDILAKKLEELERQARNNNAPKAPLSSGASQADTTFDVILKSCGTAKLDVIKIIREIMNYDFRRAKELCEALPVRVARRVTEDTADDIVLRLSSAGATVEKRSTPSMASAPSTARIMTCRVCGVQIAYNEGDEMVVCSTCGTKAIPPQANQSAQAAIPTQNTNFASGNESSFYVYKGNNELKNKNYTKAKEYFDYALHLSRNEWKAWLGLFLVENKIPDLNGIVVPRPTSKSFKDIENNLVSNNNIKKIFATQSFQNALQYSNLQNRKDLEKHVKRIEDEVQYVKNESVKLLNDIGFDVISKAGTKTGGAISHSKIFFDTALRFAPGNYDASYGLYLVSVNSKKLEYPKTEYNDADECIDVLKANEELLKSFETVVFQKLLSVSSQEQKQKLSDYMLECANTANKVRVSSVNKLVEIGQQKFNNQEFSEASDCLETALSLAEEYSLDIDKGLVYWYMAFCDIYMTDEEFFSFNDVDFTPITHLESFQKAKRYAQGELLDKISKVESYESMIINQNLIAIQSVEIDYSFTENTVAEKVKKATKISKRIGTSYKINDIIASVAILLMAVAMTLFTFGPFNVRTTNLSVIILAGVAVLTFVITKLFASKKKLNSANAEINTYTSILKEKANRINLLRESCNQNERVTCEQYSTVTNNSVSNSFATFVTAIFIAIFLLIALMAHTSHIAGPVFLSAVALLVFGALYKYAFKYEGYEISNFVKVVMLVIVFMYFVSLVTNIEEIASLSNYNFLKESISFSRKENRLGFIMILIMGLQVFISFAAFEDFTPGFFFSLVPFGLCATAMMSKVAWRLEGIGLFHIVIMLIPSIIYGILVAGSYLAISKDGDQF